MIARCDRDRGAAKGAAGSRTRTENDKPSAQRTHGAGKSGFRTTTCRSEGGVSFSPASCIGSPQREGNGETMVGGKVLLRNLRRKGYERGSDIPVDREIGGPYRLNVSVREKLGKDIPSRLRLSSVDVRYRAT